MSQRSISHIAENPMPGDVIELQESGEDDCERLLRVLAVIEDHVGFKEYGKGRFWLHKKAWKARIERSTVRKVFRPGDHDLPF